MASDLQVPVVTAFAPSEATRGGADVAPRDAAAPALRVVLISTYELGRQPFGVASAAAWLRRAGASVTCLDLAVDALAERPLADADLAAFYVPMHTATRLAVAAAERVTAINPDVHLCFFGLYAPMNEAFLRRLGAKTILGGEFEQGLAALAERLTKDPGVYEQDPGREPLVSLGRQQFLVPDRAGLPALGRYASVTLPNGERRTAGYTEASRGCKHTCRHCPIVPVYGGRFRVVPRDVVLEDIRRQVAAGARHITFGDPDFFNGIGHALPLVEALHREFPDLSYDVTIKIEHLRRHAEHIATLRETGCLFVTSAAESIDDAVLATFAKGHTRQQFIEVVSLFRTNGLALCPTFVAFTPWTSLTGYRDLLALIADLGLIDNVPPIQLAVRLLIPAGSRLLDLPEVRAFVDAFDDVGLSYRWTHPDARVDELCADVTAAVEGSLRANASRRDAFQRIWTLTHAALGMKTAALPPCPEGSGVQAPRVSEPWFC
jgi:radical SAM superfamily enzyme YgiQ (UPF0313 family)